MRWPDEYLGHDAVVHAGLGTADHARAAIKLLSTDVVRRTLYTHTGWRRIDDVWVYLHAGGALGAQGPVDGIQVSLPLELTPFMLPTPEADPRDAIRASVRLLDLAPDPIMVPLYGSIWRAIIGEPDFSVALYGPTGIFKTETAALAQQHHGSGFTSAALPTNFQSTANFNQAIAFVAKDAIVVADEFCPPALGRDRDHMHREAARLLRAQGNRSGRGRMKADTTLRAQKKPRGLIIATAEDKPHGQSLNARMLIVEVRRGDIVAERLTRCQADAGAGLYAQTASAFITWLASRLDQVQKDFHQMVVDARARPELKHAHRRTTDVHAQLIAMYSVFTQFLLETKTITEEEAQVLQKRVGAALNEAASAQAGLSNHEEPTVRFAELLRSAIALGAAHIATRSGGTPILMEGTCGWREKIIGVGDNERHEWQPQKDRIGWLDGDDLYLDPAASYQAAQRMASHDGVGVEVSSFTLARRLRDEHLLVSVDKPRQTLTVRRVIEGRQQDVWHFRSDFLSLSPAQKPDIPDIDDNDNSPTDTLP